STKMSDRKYTDQSLKHLIGEMLRNSNMEQRYTEMEIIRCYNEVVGEVIARKTKEVRLRGKKLIIKPDSGPLKEELMHMKRKIVGLVNERIGRVVVEEVEIW
ncbi:MAG: DUF721 domain-containing protein, partial [Flavobacteriales bacterium]